MATSFADFMATANKINKERFVAAREHAKTCNHQPPCLGPMFCLPLVDICMKDYFDAGLSPEQALDAINAEEESVNAAMCRAEAY